MQLLYPEVTLKYKVTKWFKPSIDYRGFYELNKYGNYKYSNRFNVNLNFDVLLQTLLHKITNLDIDKIKKNTSLIRYGLDSITSVQIKEQIEEKFNVSLPLTTILSDITIKELTIIIQSELKKYNN